MKKCPWWWWINPWLSLRRVSTAYCVALGIIRDQAIEKHKRRKPMTTDANTELVAALREMEDAVASLDEHRQGE